MQKNTRQGDINLLTFYTKVGTLKITARFSTTSNQIALPEPEEINNIINKEFDHDLSLFENSKKIKNELGGYCYHVVLTPQLKGLRYSYEIETK